MCNQIWKPMGCVCVCVYRMDMEKNDAWKNTQNI